MNNKNITEFFQDIVLGKFIVNFIPGLILFYVLTMFIDVRTGEGLMSFVIVTSVSWTLGALLEFVFFRKAFFKRWLEGSSSNMDNVLLLFGKIGMATLIACIFWIDLKWILNLFESIHEENMEIVNVVVKFSLFLIGGGLLYWVYAKRSKA